MHVVVSSRAAQGQPRRMLTTRQKENLIKKFKTHDSDTGSSEIQIALLSEEISRLSTHLKKHTKDNNSRRGLLKMVAKRRRLLNYLKDEDEKRYNSLVKKLDLK